MVWVRLWETFLALLMAWGVIIFIRAAFWAFVRPRRAPKQDTVHPGRKHDGG